MQSALLPHALLCLVAYVPQRRLPRRVSCAHAHQPWLDRLRVETCAQLGPRAASPHAPFEVARPYSFSLLQALLVCRSIPASTLRSSSLFLLLLSLKSVVSTNFFALHSLHKGWILLIQLVPPLETGTTWSATNFLWR